MAILNHLILDFIGLTKIVYNPYSCQLIICDSTGKVIILKDQNAATNANKALQSLNAGSNEPVAQKVWLNYLNKKQTQV